MNIRQSRQQSGLSYVEVLVATLLIAIALVPMMESLQPGLQGSEILRRQSEVHFALRGKLESVLTEPFASLDAAASVAGAHTAATSYSDLAATVPHEVFIWRYDVDNADNDDDPYTGGESDMLWLRIASLNGDFSIQTLLSPY
jgi:Tfp pilus assembly protein PilV